MVRAISKAAGVTEPTADEKDPAFLALQVRSLIGTVNNLVKTQENNVQDILKAFSMVDAHQQVLARIVRELALAVGEVRRLQVDGDVTLSKGDLGALKVLEDGSLDMSSYYHEYSAVGNQAGIDADRAVVLWSQGCSVEESISRAKLERSRRDKKVEHVADPNYVEEFFGGTNGQDHQQQDASAT